MLSQILARRPARLRDDVVRMISDIDRTLPDTDGLKWFNRLYLEVTLAVNQAVAGGAFRDPGFIVSLDVVFANLYFDAAAAGDAAPSEAPPAWRPLFHARQQPNIARIQFALAGMNAHINRDLPDGIVKSFLAVGGSPTKTDARHDDFERVNGILETVEAQVKSTFSVGVIGDIDKIAGRLDDILAMWSVRSARDAAWTHAEVLWTLGPAPLLRSGFFSNLDHFTGFAGRGLLVPVI